MFHLEVEPLSLSETSDTVVKQISSLLEEVISEKFHFEDPSDFLAWAEDAFPLYHCKKDPLNPETAHIIIFSWLSSGFYAQHYGAPLKKRLISQKDLSDLSIQYFDFGISGIHNKRFCMIETKVPEKEIDESYASSLKKLIKQTFLDVQPSKEVLIQQEIENVRRRFHQWLEASVLEEMKCLLALASREFIEQRSFRLLSRLVLSQHFMHKMLIKSSMNAPQARHATCRLLSARLTFPFTSKTVLGVFVGISFLHKHDFFSEEHLLRAIQKLIPESQCVPGSTYVFQRHGHPFKFIYLEIEKKGGRAFSLDERRQLAHSLKEQVKWSVEKLQPSVFMVNNEEEIAKNILVLSREISSVSDLSQVTIHFEEQTETDIRFRIIMVQPFNKHQPCLEKSFQAHTSCALYLPGRVQTVRHLRKKHPIQAQVFQVCLPKSSKLLRSDASLNFYAARSHICELLTQVIGPFRDYNGGIILKQGENLEQFKRLFRNHPNDLVENFFYGITPIEIQAIIRLEVIATLFELFVEGKNHSLAPKPHYFVKCLRKGDHTYGIFKTQDSSAYEFLMEA
ncbi:MAG: hypothetical protein ACRDFB_04570, partial [Rhabdochlamydiaceae bacterium]